MRKLILAAALALSLPGCAGTGGLNSSAPLEQTTFDEKALSTAWASLGFAAVAVDKLTASGKIKKDTPAGDIAKDALLKVETALDAATAAKNALSTTDYAAAMLEAKEGFDELASLLKGL